MQEYLENYYPSAMESLITDVYKKRRIYNPQDIDLELFVEESENIAIRYLSRPSTTFKLHDTYFIVIDDRMPWEQQRVELAHELGHVMLHAGRQDFMESNLKAMQEWQADRFAFYALMPTYMMANCWIQASTRAQMAEQLAYHFDVPVTFADARLELLDRRLRSIAAQQRLATVINEERASYDYSFRHPANPRIEYLVKDGQVVHRRLRAEV